MKKIKVIALLLCCVFVLTSCMPQTKPLVRENKLQVVFTIDTEDKYGEIPNMIECDFANEGNCGVDWIMDTFEQYNMRAVFFVNVYEHLRYSGDYEKYMEKLLTHISERGHEVGLHSHSEETLNFYLDELTDCSYEQQEKIITYGIDFIREHTGKAPISFRGGGYKVNDVTFDILDKHGILYDSSYYYENSSNTFKEYNALNYVCMANDEVDNLIEFPVIRTIKKDGTLSKLDINNMTVEEMIEVFEQMKADDEYSAAQIMFHSFSFIDQREQPFITPDFHEGTHMAYGVREDLQKRLTDLLDYMSNDPDIEVVTFEQLDKNRLNITENSNMDTIFVCDSEKARETAKTFNYIEENKYSRDPVLNRHKTGLPDIRWFVPQDVDVKQDGTTITFTNNYKPELAQYAWYINDCDNEEVIDRILYSDTSRILQYSFDKDGHYQVKAFVMFDESKKSSKIIADIYVQNGVAEIILANPS